MTASARAGRGKSAPMSTMQQEGSNRNLKWFAARAISDRAYVLKYLEHFGFEYRRIASLPTLIFIHCSSRRIAGLRLELYDRVLFYMNAEKNRVQPVPERAMRSFLIFAPLHGKMLIYLPVDDPSIFDGPVYRVTSGDFAGCEGVLKRLKGEKRLVVRINDHAAVATPHIPAKLLEPVLELGEGF